MISHRQADLLDQMKIERLIGKTLYYAPTAGEQMGHFGTIVEANDEYLISKGDPKSKGSKWMVDKYKIHYETKDLVRLVNK
jgi:hypothetical protein